MRNLISKRLLTQLTAGNLKAFATSIGRGNTFRPLSTSHHLNTDYEWHSSGSRQYILVKNLTTVDDYLDGFFRRSPNVR